MHILFVCTGNICRSPIAERLATAYAAQEQIADLTASSAGTRAVIGHPMHANAALVLESLGGDSSGFSARQLTSRIASDADLVLTMTRAQRETVLEHAPNQIQRTFTLGEAEQLASTFNATSVAELAICRPRLAAHEFSDVPDPIGHGPGVFATIGSQISDLLLPVLELCRGQ
ncbi:low molecular weight phosphatase family protein [Mycolicibacterium sp. PAM1]|nr:low molecular weight phosphatase family protein [Mycolicibacterium sp. PAM1]